MIVWLLKIAAKTGRYEGVSKLFKEFDDGRAVGPAVHYLRGKTLYRQGKPGKAVGFLSKAAQSGKYEYRARYFKGVCFARQGKYAKARNVFRSLTGEIEPRGEKEKKVLHLSYLALGRISYEQRKLEEAINFYKKLPRSSEYFDRALYELTWVLVSRKDYKQASRNADIFLYLANPDPTFVPEMKLLKADLLLRTDDYEQASMTYKNVIEQFRPVRKRMEQFLGKKEGSVLKYFHQLVEQDLEGGNTLYMPKQVQKWIDRGEKLERAKLMVRDVAKLQKDIEETRRAIEEMKARLESGSTLESFPNLAEGMTVGIAVDSQLIGLQRKLLKKEYQVLRPTMNASEKQKWKTLQAELEKFQERYENIPKTKKAVKKRTQSVDKAFQQLEKKLDSVRYLIDGQKEQLTSINEYIQNNYEEGLEELPKKQERKIRALRSEVRENIRKLERAEKKIRERIGIVRQKVGVGDKVTREERKLRQKYRELLKERRKFLEQFHERASAGQRRKLDKIAKARRFLRPAGEDLQKFFSKMRNLVDKKSQELQQKIQQQEKLLAKRQETLDKMMDRSKKEAARAALRDYLRVRDKFDEIVMRGDVGLLDVVWQKKQEKSQKLDQLRENRRRELKQLQQSFQEVR